MTLKEFQPRVSTKIEAPQNISEDWKTLLEFWELGELDEIKSRNFIIRFERIIGEQNIPSAVTVVVYNNSEAFLVAFEVGLGGITEQVYANDWQLYKAIPLINDGMANFDRGGPPRDDLSKEERTKKDKEDLLSVLEFVKKVSQESQTTS